MNSNSEKIILGIDPGTLILGYGIIRVKGNSFSMTEMGVLHLNKLGDHTLKLKKIFESTLELIDQYHPDD